MSSLPARPRLCLTSGWGTSDGRTSRFTIIAWEPERRYVYAIPLPLGRLVVDRSLERAANGGTRFTHTVSLTGLAGVLLGRSLGRKFRAELPLVMQNLARAANDNPR